MTAKIPGASLPNEERPCLSAFTQPDVEARYRQYVADNHGDISDIPRLCEVMYFAGARQMLMTSAVFSGIGPRLERLEQDVARLRTMWLDLDERLPV